MRFPQGQGWKIWDVMLTPYPSTNQFVARACPFLGEMCLDSILEGTKPAPILTRSSSRELRIRVPFFL